MTTFIALGDVFWFVGGFAVCYFVGVIKAWLVSKAADALTAGKAEASRVATDIEAKL
jgi:hypothetical protein